MLEDYEPATRPLSPPSCLSFAFARNSLPVVGVESTDIVPTQDASGLQSIIIEDECLFVVLPLLEESLIKHGGVLLM